MSLNGRTSEGQEVDITLDGEVLTIWRRIRHYRLEELITQVTDDNLHEETDWGEPEGKEVW